MITSAEGYPQGRPGWARFVRCCGGLNGGGWCRSATRASVLSLPGRRDRRLRVGGELARDL